MSTIPTPAPTPSTDSAVLFALLEEFKREVREDLAGLATRLDEKVVLKEVHDLELAAVKDDIARLRRFLNWIAVAVGTAGSSALSAYLYHIFSSSH